MAKKYSVEVRQAAPGASLYDSSAPFTVIETVKRTLRAEAIGNFNPIFCTYKGKRTLVHSEQGDLSDPFRRETSYLTTLFIRVSPPVEK